jgi:hypothetical protein
VILDSLIVEREEVAPDGVKLFVNECRMLHPRRGAAIPGQLRLEA